MSSATKTNSGDEGNRKFSNTGELFWKCSLLREFGNRCVNSAVESTDDNPSGKKKTAKKTNACRDQVAAILRSCDMLTRGKRNKKNLLGKTTAEFRKGRPHEQVAQVSRPKDSAPKDRHAGAWDARLFFPPFFPNDCVRRCFPAHCIAAA